MVWYGMVWYGMVWYGMVWYGMVWYGMVWYGMVWYGMVWYSIQIMNVYECNGKNIFMRFSMVRIFSSYWKTPSFTE